VRQTDLELLESGADRDPASEVPVGVDRLTPPARSQEHPALRVLVRNRCSAVELLASGRSGAIGGLDAETAWMKRPGARRLPPLAEHDSVGLDPILTRGPGMLVVDQQHETVGWSSQILAEPEGGPKTGGSSPKSTSGASDDTGEGPRGAQS